MKELDDLSEYPYISPQIEYKLEVPEYSEWKCYMFGATDSNGILYHPRKGLEPNRFVRWMMKICFDCTWVKEG